MFVIPDSIQTASYLSIIEISVLRALAHHCGSKRECWPSVLRISLFCRRSPRTIQRTLPRLEELKLIEIRERKGRSNVYIVTCLEERGVINRGDIMASDEQNTQKKELERWETPVDNSPKNSRPVAKALFEDIAELMGPVLTEKNAGWYKTIAKRVPWEIVQHALATVQRRILEGAVTGDVIRNRSGFFTRILQYQGAI